MEMKGKNENENVDKDEELKEKPDIRQHFADPSQAWAKHALKQQKVGGRIVQQLKDKAKDHGGADE